MSSTDLCHPDKDRPLSIQEFPDDWKFFGEMKDVYKQIGNAVPISLGFAIGKQVVKLISSQELDLPPMVSNISFPIRTTDLLWKSNIPIGGLNEYDVLYSP